MFQMVLQFNLDFRGLFIKTSPPMSRLICDRNVVIVDLGSVLMGVWSKVLPLTASCLSSVTAWARIPAGTCEKLKLPVNWG